jgi:MFS transporter, DHA1 family, multidrug resistance protein
MYEDVFGVVTWFPALFASVAGAMVVSSIVNSRWVGRLGMRRMSHGALIGMIGLMFLANLVHLAVGVVPIWVFVPIMSLSFFCVGIVLPNFNALAMEPLGPIAGTGSAFVGFTMTGLGAIVTVTEGGRLAQPVAHGAPAE